MTLNKPNFIRSFIIFLVLLYQKLKRNLFPLPSCRFYPTCSDYTIEALAHFGLPNGGFLALKRLIRCNQWFPGGYDPVPRKR